MKKLLLVAAVLFASYGVFADLFDKVVEGMRSEEGVTVRPDKPHRIIFADYKLPSEITSEQFAEIKTLLKKEIKKDEDAVSLIKEINITFIFNYVTKGGKIYSVVIGPRDL